MNRVEFRMAQASVLCNKGLKKGLDAFEKYAGRINWLHPEERMFDGKVNRKYAVYNTQGEVIFEADKQSDIAKEFCVSTSRVNDCINGYILLKDKYLIERCGNE